MAHAPAHIGGVDRREHEVQAAAPRAIDGVRVGARGRSGGHREFHVTHRARQDGRHHWWPVSAGADDGAGLSLAVGWAEPGAWPDSISLVAT